MKGWFEESPKYYFQWPSSAVHDLFKLLLVHGASFLLEDLEREEKVFMCDGLKILHQGKYDPFSSGAYSTHHSTVKDDPNYLPPHRELINELFN